ncbi:MAG TPA: hypothetical protein VJ973_01065 [Christiangramia sp.]|nr:hypothetical protein [Christiangramia sp.]
MKNLKPYGLLLLMALSLTSCEQDSITEGQPSQTKDLNSASLFDSKEEFDNYVASMDKSKRTYSVNKAMSSTGNTEISSSFETFSEICSEINTDDFSSMQTPLLFQTFSAPLAADLNDEFFYENFIDGVSVSSDSEILALLNYGDFDSQIYTTSSGDAMTLSFPEGINALGLKLFNLQSNDEVIVEVYNDDVMVDEVTSFSYAFNSMFIGINSQSKFNKVKIYSEKYAAWIGLDEISFGSCSVDADGDGCVDDEDPFVNSNMEELISMGDCSTGIPNQMTAECGVTMADLIGAAHDEAKNHGEFVSTMTKMVNSWVKAGLLAKSEKGDLMSCAAAWKK